MQGGRLLQEISKVKAKKVQVLTAGFITLAA